MKLYCGACKHAGNAMHSRFNTVVCLSCGAMYDADIAARYTEEQEAKERIEEYIQGGPEADDGAEV